jgi:hypothetical protein
MGSYRKPKARLHRDFVYLQHETILNSLSAFEAGKVDDIIQKTSAATDKGLEAGVQKGPIKAGGSRKKQAQVQEELVLTRTYFSAFEAWYERMAADEALGEFDAWDMEVRDAIDVGDTIRFQADIVLSPLYHVIAAYTSFVKDSSNPASVLKLSGPEAAEAKRTARMMEQWVTRSSGQRSTLAYFHPFGINEPNIVGSLDDKFLIGGLDNVQGRFTVVAQVDTTLEDENTVSAIRILRDVPPTPMEIQTSREAFTHLIEPAKELGVTITEDDITFSHPTILIRPLAIFK